MMDRLICHFRKWNTAEVLIARLDEDFKELFGMGEHDAEELQDELDQVDAAGGPLTSADIRRLAAEMVDDLSSIENCTEFHIYDLLEQHALNDPKARLIEENDDWNQMFALMDLFYIEADDAGYMLLTAINDIGAAIGPPWVYGLELRRRPTLLQKMKARRALTFRRNETE